MKNVNRAVCVGLLLMLTLPLHAATQVTEVWRSYAGSGFFRSEGKTITAYGEAQARFETERERWLSRKPEVSVDIDRLDLDKRWALDPRKKRYTEVGISEARAAQETKMENDRKAWEKQQPSSSPDKQDQPRLRIKKAETRVSGPGALETINGFACRAYTVKTVIEYELLPEHRSLGTQTMYARQWVTDDPRLLRHEQERLRFWKTAGNAMFSQSDYKALISAFSQDVQKATSDTTADPLSGHFSAFAKAKGAMVRIQTAFTIVPKEESEPKRPEAEQPSPREDSLIQAGDLTNGVGGLVSGLATRWASKKIEKKVQDKMAERPVWVEALAKDLDTKDTIGWAWMEDVTSAVETKDSELFEVPAGYKKVQSL